MVSIDKLMRFEEGSMDFDETVELFQELVDSGMAWELQGFYGRTARDLIEAGYVHMGGRDVQNG